MIWKPMFSAFSIFMALSLFTVLTVVVCFLSKKAGWRTLKLMGIGIILAVVRCLFPVEFPGVKVICVNGLASRLYVWLERPLRPGISPIEILLLIWGSVSLVLFFRLGTMLWNQHRTFKEAVVPSDHPLYPIYREVIQEMSCPRIGALSISPVYRTVLMTGFFRPNIGLPDDMEGISEKELKYIFEHELTHYMLRDLWIKLFIEILRCLLWWNPVVYFLDSCVGQLLEMRCDSRVCKHWSMKERTDYAKTLITIFRKQAGQSVFLSAGYLGYSSEEHIKQRFHQILYADNQTKRRNGPFLLAIIMSVVFFVLSYSFIFLPSITPSNLEIGDATVFSNGDTEYILRFPDGKLELYINNQLYAVITSEHLDNEKISGIPIYDVNISF